jgi:hypothetical protein
MMFDIFVRVTDENARNNHGHADEAVGADVKKVVGHWALVIGDW